MTIVYVLLAILFIGNMLQAQLFKRLMRRLDRLEDALGLQRRP